MKIVSFEDLVVWQKAQQIAIRVYQLADSNEYASKDFSLKNQLKRAAISISDNIAEGFEYNNNPDFYPFLRIAKGSCGETRNKILFIKKMNYIDDVTSKELEADLLVLGLQIGRLMKSVKEKISSQKNPVSNRNSPVTLITGNPPKTHNS